MIVQDCISKSRICCRESTFFGSYNRKRRFYRKKSSLEHVCIPWYARCGDHIPYIHNTVAEVAEIVRTPNIDKWKTRGIAKPMPTFTNPNSGLSQDNLPGTEFVGITYDRENDREVMMIPRSSCDVVRECKSHVHHARHSKNHQLEHTRYDLEPSGRERTRRGRDSENKLLQLLTHNLGIASVSP